jgi:hypothetical protein
MSVKSKTELSASFKFVGNTIVAHKIETILPLDRYGFIYTNDASTSKKGIYRMPVDSTTGKTGTTYDFGSDAYWKIY